MNSRKHFGHNLAAAADARFTLTPRVTSSAALAAKASADIGQTRVTGTKDMHAQTRVTGTQDMHAQTDAGRVHKTRMWADRCKHPGLFIKKTRM